MEDEKKGILKFKNNLNHDRSNESRLRIKPLDLYNERSSFEEDLSKIHKPTNEFLVRCITLFQNLFDIDCYINVPTKMNEIYYKYGRLNNFKNAIQKIFDPG